MAAASHCRPHRHAHRSDRCARGVSHRPARQHARAGADCSSTRCSGFTRSCGGSARASWPSASAPATRECWRRAAPPNLRGKHFENVPALYRIAGRQRSRRDRRRSEAAHRSHRKERTGAPAGRATEDALLVAALVLLFLPTAAGVSACVPRRSDEAPKEAQV